MRSCLRRLLSRTASTSPRPSFLLIEPSLKCRPQSRCRADAPAPGPTLGPRIPTSAGLLISGLLGAVIGTAFQYYWKSQTPSGSSKRSQTPEEAQAEIFKELAVVLHNSENTDVDMVLNGEKGELLVLAVRESFAAQGLPAISPELTRWFIRAVYGKQEELDVKLAAELRSFLGAFQRRQKAEYQLHVPSETGAVLVDRRSRSVQPTPLLEGSYTLPGSVAAVKFELQPRTKTVSVLVSRVATQIELAITFSPDRQRLPELYQHFGDKYDDEILPALADTIANETLVEMDLQSPFVPAYQERVAEKLARECGELGMKIEQVTIAAPAKKDKTRSRKEELK